ncbi:DUF3572 domain-containing protein [Allosphingosinicella vermicomposti]|uniref:DUF3572 domain-containing protein n=1 Tax=Allosphingosinicella vermicomposti TaxID=614671 RepID=UPI000D0F8827|nr:DUF3572 domain-containing protein [Allosphingosinicella vermicomposti]
MNIKDTRDEDSATLKALAALGWILSDEGRAQRLLSLTGLTPDDLRNRVSSPEVLAAVLAFLEAHEPDLIVCADAISATPAALIDARRSLDR